MTNLLNQKVGFFSDVHIGLYQDNPEWHNIAIEFAKKCSSFYKENKITDIIIAGDVFHNRSELSITTIQTAKEFFDCFKEFNIIISSGNHDSFYKEKSTVNSICLLDGWPNITIVDKEPLILKTKKGTSISFIPWGTSCIDIPKTDICVGHFEINTFYMNSYKSCEKGEESKNLLEKSPFIISGHFHKKDHRVYEKGQILYLGSPYQHNFGDSGDDRGYYIIDLDNKKFEFINNTLSPKFVKINSETFKNKNMKHEIENNFVSITIEEHLKQDEVNNILTKIQILNPFNIKMEYKSTEKENSVDSKTYDSIDIIKNINDYVDTLDIEYKEDTINYLTEIYNTLNK